MISKRVITSMKRDVLISTEILFLITIVSRIKAFSIRLTELRLINGVSSMRIICLYLRRLTSKGKKDYFTDFIDNNKENIDKFKVKIKRKDDEEKHVCDKYLRNRDGVGFQYSENDKRFNVVDQGEKDQVISNFGIKFHHKRQGEKSKTSLSPVKRAKEIIDKNNLEKIRAVYY